jgi:hypothetical protein
MNIFEYLANIFETMKWLVGCILVVFSLCGVFKFVIFENQKFTATPFLPKVLKFGILKVASVAIGLFWYFIWPACQFCFDETQPELFDATVMGIFGGCCMSYLMQESLDAFKSWDKGFRKNV